VTYPERGKSRETPYPFTMSSKLAAPTQEELLRIWTSTHPSWGAALSLQSYLDRETSQIDIPLARNGGLSRWILTTDAAGSPQRPLLSSCETLRKRAVVRDAGVAVGGQVRDVAAHGVGSVFTDAEHRRKGYAGLMMGKLGEALGKGSEEPLFSVLYSDIGKVFYAKQGWVPFESAHLEFPASSTAESASSDTLKVIKPEDIPELAAADEALVRAAVANAPPSPKSIVAILPDTDQIQWHAAREALQCERLLSRVPSTHGVLYTAPTSRVWAIWKRNHSAPATEPDKNTLFILRFVVEDEKSISDEDLTKATDAIISAARREASEWACGKVEMWNPSERLRRLAEGNSNLDAKYVVREDDSITSLRWFGQGTADNVEWIFNEKYAWC
jgi:hypothetical protein